MILYLISKLLKKLRPAATKNSIIHKTSKIEPGSEFINSTMDKHSFCGYNCDINNTDIGSFCSIANSVVIGGGMHPIDWVSTSPVFYEGRDSIKAKFSEHFRPPLKKTQIGHDVWIGQNVIIKQGVSIGNGAVIGMGAVVTKNVESYSIVAGCPAKLVRKRFEQSIIDELENLEWWLIDDAKLSSLGRFVKDPRMFINKASLLINSDVNN